jgi:predicted metal-binding membrane protein
VVSTNSPLLRRERYLILGTLLILAAIAWGVLIWQTHGMNNQGMGLTMGMSAALFIALWAVMMVAMMLPSAAPMILMFSAVYAGKRQKEQPFVPTWIFVSAYLLVWILCGALAYPLALGADKLASQSMWIMENAARFGGIILVAAGLYQLSPLKRICLSKCRTPLQFILTSWRDGYGGTFRMGFEHGIYCLGCCWLLFVILFPLGIMNIAVMALVTVLIFAEKAFPIGPRIAQLAALVLIAYGVLVIFMPNFLPTMQTPM